MFVMHKQIDYKYCVLYRDIYTGQRYFPNKLKRLQIDNLVIVTNRNYDNKTNCYKYYKRL